MLRDDTTPLTVAIASGKGGTGKTLVATNLAYIAAVTGTPVALVDCDAEAPNDAIFLPAAETTRHTVETTEVVVDAEACTACGICRDACAYGAMRILGASAMLFPELCHGCGLCAHVCPTGAIADTARRVGEVSVGEVRLARSAANGSPAALSLVTGKLDVGEVKTPEIIRAARSIAVEIAPQLTILDAPSGVACAAVAAVRGADALLLVTEPTPFGLHDLELSFELGVDLGIPMGVLVNRSGAGKTDVDAWCNDRRIPVLAHIGFNRAIAEVYARGELLAAVDPLYHDVFRRVLASLRLLGSTRPQAVLVR